MISHLLTFLLESLPTKLALAAISAVAVAYVPEWWHMRRYRSRAAQTLLEREVVEHRAARDERIADDERRAREAELEQEQQLRASVERSEAVSAAEFAEASKISDDDREAARRWLPSLRAVTPGRRRQREPITFDILATLRRIRREPAMTEFHAWCKVFMDRGTPDHEAVRRVMHHGVDKLRAEFGEHNPELVAKVDALIAPRWRWTEPVRRYA